MGRYTNRVALESTVIAHGLPYPHNVETALHLEEIVRQAGGAPRTIGIRRGKLIAGLSEADIRHLARADDVRKVSRRDLPIAIAGQFDGATTVAATMWIAHREGIRVFATGGIGGVHRPAPGASVSHDVSADLLELHQTPVAVVCAGAKAILDLSATRERLETLGVTVVGYRTDEFPAFYTRSSGLPVDVRCDSAEEVADLLRAHDRLGLPGGTLVCVPVPEAEALPPDLVEPAIAQALDEADAGGFRSAEVTPFLLRRVAELTGERSLAANLALLENNARVAARIALALAAEPPRLA